MSTNNVDLQKALKSIFGFSAFKGKQEDIIRSIMEGNHTFVLMPTGGGKSLCYQLPALLKEGTAIVISPLIALMKNQVDVVRGISGTDKIAHVLNSSLTKGEIRTVMEDIRNGDTKLLYVAPESLTKDEYADFLRTINISFVAVDEAHCISEWGHDFRPEYRNIKTIIERLGEGIPIIALTATATTKVQEDILKNLGIPQANVFKSSFNRPNLYYEVRPKTKNINSDIIRFVKQRPGQSGIIYCLSRKSVEELAQTLQVNGITAIPYHAGLDAKTRAKHQDMFLMEEVEVVVATIAFGMGIDKPDVRMVIHWNIPLTLEDYFQEAGRAGRDGKAASAIMIYNETDIETAEKLMGDYLIDIPFLKLVYAKLNSYFKIAIGEGTNETFGFMFPDFCMQYELPTLKTYNALQALDRFSVISLSQQFNNKVSFQLTAPISTLIEYDHSHRHLSATLFYLARTYPLIYSQPVVLDTAKITEYTDLNYYQLIDYLEQIDRDGMGVLKNEQSDVQITFNLPRDDDRTINSIGKNIKEYNHTKLALQQEVYRYLNNEKKCRSQQLLEYFGEKTTHPCGICSNCIAHHKPKKIDKKQVREELWELLKKAPIRPSDILIKMPYTKEVINPILEEWLITEKIEFTVRNELFVK